MPDGLSVTKESETRSKFRIFIKGSIEAVWQEITQTGGANAAFFNSQMDVKSLAPGNKLAMRSVNGKYTWVVGEILVFEPPTRFSHTFKLTNLDDPACVVTYELAEAEEGGENGVEFTLTVSDLPVGTKTAKQMIGGCEMICKTLKSVVETGRASLGTRTMYLVFGLMSPLMRKKCSSKKWPID